MVHLSFSCVGKKFTEMFSRLLEIRLNEGRSANQGTSFWSAGELFWYEDPRRRASWHWLSHRVNIIQPNLVMIPLGCYYLRKLDSFFNFVWTVRSFSSCCSLQRKKWSSVRFCTGLCVFNYRISACKGRHSVSLPHEAIRVLEYEKELSITWNMAGVTENNHSKMLLN